MSGSVDLYLEEKNERKLILENWQKPGFVNVSDVVLDQVKKGKRKEMVLKREIDIEVE